MGGLLLAGIVAAFLAGLGALFFGLAALSLNPPAAFVLLRGALIISEIGTSGRRPDRAREDHREPNVSNYEVFVILLALFGFASSVDGQTFVHSPWGFLMATLLLPCDGTSDALLAVRHAVDAFRRGDVLMVHLLNVQPPFSANVTRHVSRELRFDFHRERGALALAEAQQILKTAGVPHDTHTEVGDKACCIADAACRLRCDRVVIGTARKSALVRAVENSLTNRVLECCSVPVEVVVGAPVGVLERFGIPAALGTGMALLWLGGP